MGSGERRETKVWPAVDRRQASGIGYEALAGANALSRERTNRP